MQGNIYDTMNYMLGEAMTGAFTKKKKATTLAEPKYSKEKFEFRSAIGKLTYDLPGSLYVRLITW